MQAILFLTLRTMFYSPLSLFNFISPPHLFYIFSIHKYIDLLATLHRPHIDPTLNFFLTLLRK